MKVKDLISEIAEGKQSYGNDFLEWDVYTEQLDLEDKEHKLAHNWETKTCSEGWEYYKCHGWHTKFPQDRVFTINVNY